MEILVKVVNQKLKIASNLKSVVAGTQEFISFKFTYGDDWSELTTFAQFTQNGNSYNVYLDENDCCYLPPEIVSGKCTVMLFGTKTVTIREVPHTTRATTNVIEFEITPNMLIENASSTEITQTLYDQLVQKVNEVLDLSDSDYSDLIKSEIARILGEYLDNGDLAAATIGDGTIEKAKLNSSLQASIDKADNSWQKNVSETSTPTSGSWEATYDPAGYGKRNPPIDPYSFAQTQRDTAIARMRGISSVAEVNNGSQTFTLHDQTDNVDRSYTGVDSALEGVYNLANKEANRMVINALAGYTPINIVVDPVGGLPETGADRTFYLISKGNGKYDKWWYITNEQGVKVWDNFGSSSTVVDSTLPPSSEAQEDVDYIIGSGSDYQYYKYINGEWKLIAGSNSQVFESIPFTYNGVQDTSSNTIFFNGAPTSSDSLNGMEIGIDVTTMTVYILEVVVSPSSPDVYSWVNCGSFISNPSATKDYYIIEGGTSFAHFRYIGNTFKQIGSSAYTKAETDALIQASANTLNTSINGNASNISNLNTLFNRIGNLVKSVTMRTDNSTKKTYLDITYTDINTETDDVVAIELDTGMHIDRTLYDVDGDNTLHFYDADGNEYEDLAVYISGGGGGSGGASQGTVSIGRVTAANVQSVYGDSCVIEYTVIATDASGDPVGNGVGTLYINNIPVNTGFEVSTSILGASNSIDVGNYLSVGSNAVKISVSVNTGGESNTVATKTWTVSAVNMYFDWNPTDSEIHRSAYTDYFTPYGALNKTIYTFIDVDPIGFNPEFVDELPNSADAETGVNYFVYDSENDSYSHYIWDENDSDYVTANGNVLNVSSTIRSGAQQSVLIPMQTHGSHAIVRYMVGTISGTGATIKTAQQVHDMIFVDDIDMSPVISVSFNTKAMTQYNAVQIPIVVYDPRGITTTVTLAENGNTVSTWTNVDRTIHYWNYSPTTYGSKILTITCGTTTKTLNIEVEELDIDEAEISGYDFRFKASEMATNDAVRSWSSTYTPVGSNTPETIGMTFSSNFDWINGGLHTELDENNHLRQYMCVRAGTTMTINYNLFGQTYDPKQYGKVFKFIFKAVNCRNYDANVLSCVDTSSGNNGVGLVMTANGATLSTVNEDIETYYCKDTYIEFEINIHPIREYRYLQIWMDGSHDKTILYSSDDTMQQVNPVNITIGSNDCDVYVYMVKAYPTYLTNNNMLSNFIMDAPNAYEMVSRYNRNNILGESGEIDYETLANANPDLHVLLLDLNRMSTGKKDNTVAHTFRHIYNAGGQAHCFTVNNCCVTIQGTSSVGYLESAGNVDINFKNGRTFTSDNVSYTTGSITFDNNTTSTKGYAMTDNSIAVDYLNVKLNVASSENANNACIADWYNTYQPWASPAKKKNSKARDTIEFVPGVIFIRDRSGNLFGDTNGYHFYGICDMGNSKKNTKVFHDTTNPIAVCMEVSNNTSLPCLMSSDNYSWNADDDAVTVEIVDGEQKTQKVFEFRYVMDGMESVAESNWDRFAKFLIDHNPNNATGNAITSTTFGTYTFKGSGTYNTSAYDNDDYDVVYLYGYGLPSTYNNGIYSASNYVTDTSGENTCYYYINYSNNYIYSSNGTTWTAIAELTWTADRNNVLAGTSIDTYAGTYTTDSFNYRMAYLLEHCEEYMIIDPVVYHFVFIESFLMTDNVAKNTFWSTDDGVHWEPSKDYDNDNFVVVKPFLIYGES